MESYPFDNKSRKLPKLLKLSKQSFLNLLSYFHYFIFIFVFIFCIINLLDVKASKSIEVEVETSIKHSSQLVLALFSLKAIIGCISPHD